MQGCWDTRIKDVEIMDREMGAGAGDLAPTWHFSCAVVTGTHPGLSRNHRG